MIKLNWSLHRCHLGSEFYHGDINNSFFSDGVSSYQEFEVYLLLIIELVIPGA